MGKKPQSYEPTALQMRYQRARAEAVASGRVFTDASLAAQGGCRAATISTWKRDPTFRGWLDADARAAVEHLWRPILLRAAQLALDGSVERMKILAPFMASQTLNASHAAPQVLGVPRPVPAVRRTAARWVMRTPGP